MKDAIFKTCLSISLVLVLTTIAAQHGMVTAGGEAYDTNGRVSYSVGQVFCNIQTGFSGTALQGLQQPYEISVTTGLDKAEGMQLLFTAYPIPVSNVLTLKIDGFTPDQISKLSIHLFDMRGKQLMSKQAEGIETSIPMIYIPPGIYFLQIIGQGKGFRSIEIKTFKIIKNQSP